MDHCFFPSTTVTVALFYVTRYMVDSSPFRSGNRTKASGKKSLDDFLLEFDKTYAGTLCEANLGILLRKKEQFVGTKALNSALRFVASAIKNAKMRKLCAPHIQTILFDLTLPLMLISEQEWRLWSENPIEYVRMQVDFSNPWNVKRTNQDLIKAICNIKKTRKNKISDYLAAYLGTVASALAQAQPTDDFRHKEALMHAFGLLNLHMAASDECAANAEPLLQQHVYAELRSDSGFMRARACWVYGQFAQFEFKSDEHLAAALDALYQNLSHGDLPVRVNAAIALIKLLDQETAVTFIRPGLNDVIKIYLKLIDDIDYDELIESLRKIVDVFEDEIGPHAEDLCGKLGEAYLRLHEQKKASQEGGAALELDSETSLSCEGLMSAIRRILQSVNGRSLELYPRLEQALQQPILATLQDVDTASTDEGLTCLAELLYHQETVSGTMWGFFQLIIDSIMTDKGILDQFTDAAFVVIINIMNKDPNAFKTAGFQNAQGQQLTAMDMTLQVACKTFDVARDRDDEIEAISAITLLNAMLENIEGLQDVMPAILDKYLSELGQADTQDYSTMLLQGILMCLWYDYGVTLTKLEASAATGKLLQVIMEKVPQLKQDFEVKRFILGLSALVVASDMP